MTQKLVEGEKSVEKLLQAIDPKGIADESMRRTVEILLNLVEELNSKIKGLESENQQLRDENNRLKGEQGKPDIKAKTLIGLQGSHSSEKERQSPKKHTKSKVTINSLPSREVSWVTSPRTSLTKYIENRVYHCK